MSEYILNGDRIQFLRNRLGLTQPELSAIAKVGQSEISRMERGQNTRAEGWKIAAVATALETSTDYLLGITDDPVSPLRKSDKGARLAAAIELIDPGSLVPMRKLLDLLLEIIAEEPGD